MIVMDQTSAPSASPVASGEAVSLGPLPGMLGYMLRRAQVAVFADFAERFARDDIRPAQFSVLMVLKHNPGLRQTQASTALGVRRTNFVPLLDALEERGLVERRRVAGDRRAFALYLTREGDVLLERLSSVLAEHEAHFVRRLGPDGKTELLALLARLADPASG